MDIGAIYFAGLLGELRSYATSQSQALFAGKVRRVYYKCMRNGHPEIARRIADKYPNIVQVKSDREMAFGMALMAKKQLEK